VAIFITRTAFEITSAGRLWPFGVRGMLSDKHNMKMSAQSVYVRIVRWDCDECRDALLRDCLDQGIGQPIAPRGPALGLKLRHDPRDVRLDGDGTRMV
jgi:hypothetical protein